MSTATTTVRSGDVANKPRLRGARWWAAIGWKHIFALVIIAYCVFPLLFVLSAALNPGGTLTGTTQLFQKISWGNFQSLLTGENVLGLGTGNVVYTNYLKWMWHSFVVSGITAVGTVLMGAAAAYAFSRFRFKGRRWGLTALLIIQMFPQMLAFVAIFLLLLMLKDVFPFLGMGSQLGLICVYLGGALGANTFLMYGFFNTIPQELDEAAKIDGATHAQIFWGIIMRLVTPILAVVGLLSFVGTYGEFIIAKIVLSQPEQYTLAVGLYVATADDKTAPWSLFAAGAVLAAIPIIALFMYLQKYIVAGLTAGSVKG